MSKIGKGFILVGILGLVFVAALLLTNHSGLAIRLTNYTFGLLLIGIIYEGIKR